MNAQQQPRLPVDRPRRGASRAGEQVPGIFAKNRWMVPLLFVALICAALEMGVSAFGEVANVPIRQVSVNGDFRFLDKARIEKSMLPHLGTGFFMVNLPQIRAELERMPLVHEVTVRRAWPDRLLVFITEQVPVLRFGADGYLNPYAEVFRPDQPLAVPGLPMVDGPPGSEKLLLAAFDRYTEILEPAGLRIASIVLDGKHACRITLANGTEVLLGRREVDRKIRLLSRLLETKWASQRDGLARIDMRYSNGISVASRDAATAPSAARAQAPVAAR